MRAALYGAGRLEPLLTNTEIENVDINAFDEVWVSYRSGERSRWPEPVADSDAELKEQIRTLAAYAGLSSRAWDEANPELDLRLPDGSRLSAVMAVTERPTISIRRATMGQVFLHNLIANNTLTDTTAAFLRAAVKARKNIMIAGETSSGKTTLLRALANEIGLLVAAGEIPQQRIVTIENTFELGLNKHKDLHPDIIAMECRQPNSEGLGRVGMAALVRRSLRMNPDRVIVGEVLGDEVVSMLNAMTQGNDGSISTIHANTAQFVFERLGTYALQAEERMPVEATQRLICGAINFVVFLQRTNKYAEGGDQRRFVASIREINGYDDGVLSSEIFALNPATGAAEPAAGIQCLPDLLAAGYRQPHPHGRW
ncbi:MAG: Flp pilus assembly complex ATPase component TadA [Sporichthyaceae bacterium]|nr:Flp pilus assembly complex ATPase component TadA [Sporichthyaceae bacterium]